METQPNAVFSFTLASFRITNSRPQHEDTGYVSFTLLVKSESGREPPQTLTKSIVDITHGYRPVRFSFWPVSLAPTDVVTVSYRIVNTGHETPGEVLTILKSTGDRLANACGVAAGTAIGAAVGSITRTQGDAVGASVTWHIQQLN